MDSLNMAAAQPPGTEPHSRRWLALILLCAANFMVILDSQAVILALPSIAKDLAMPPAAAQWVLSANLLAFGGLLLLGGRAADLLGRRRAFMVGTGLFLIVSLMSGFAWNTEVMLISRALHGVSAALMAPTALSILTTTFPEGPERNKALAGWAGIAGIGATTGLLIGGGLTESFGWQWVFFVNVPVAVLMLVVSPMLLRESRDHKARRVFDVAGAVTSTAALTLLVYAIVDAPASGWGSARTLGLFAGSFVLFLIFVLIERRSAAPLVPLRIFRLGTLTGGNVVMVTMGMVAFGMSFTISQYAQGVLGESPLEFGLRQSVMPLMAFIGAYVGGAIVTRKGFRPVAVACVVLMGAGAFMLSLAPADGHYFRDLFFPLLIFGAGLGAGTVAASAAALSQVSDADSGLASGFNAAALQIGGAIGVGINTTVIAGAVTGPDPVGMTEGFQAGFAACVLFAAISLVFSIVLLRRVRGASSSGRMAHLG